MGSVARFSGPSDVLVDANGNLIVSDLGNDTIRRITSDGMVTTLGGTAGSRGSSNGVGSAARFFSPSGLTIDGVGNLLVADTQNNTIRRGLPLGAVGASRLVNLSILTSLVGVGDTVTIGVVIGGAGTSGGKPLLVRAAGPALASFGLTGLLDDPALEFFAGSTKVNESDNWGGDLITSAVFEQVGAFPFPSSTSKDSALFSSAVVRGNNSVRVSSVGNPSGKVLVELYDATFPAAFIGSTPRLVNVSVLKEIGVGLTAGFVIGGAGNRVVLIRVAGPSLAAFALPGLLTDPKLELFDGQSRSIATNDNWGGDPALSAAFRQVAAFDFANSASKDAALLIALAPGNYTVQASGVSNTTGVALVEVYEVP
jgi:hypothetical protein